eukprot:jgi/Tetstr1/435165/TSEL_002621.t1
MPDGEEPVAEPTLESLNADMRAQSSLLRELATAVAQLTARDRVVDGEGAHGSGSGQRFAGQPTGSGGVAERPDLLELAQSGRVGAKSVSAEDDYLAVPELLQRADSGYEAVRPVSRVPGLFPLSTDLTNEYLKQDDRRLPAQEEYLWMSCFGAHMAALFVALDELLPYVPATNQDFTPYLRLQLQVAGVGEDVAADVDAAAKDAFGSDELGQRTLDLLSSSLSAQTLKSYAGRLSQFAEFCHDSENISPLEATTATVVRYVAWIGERGHIAAKSLQPYLSAINTFFELHNLVPIAKDSLHLTSARRLTNPGLWNPRNDEWDRYLTDERKHATSDEYRHLLCYGVFTAAAHAALTDAVATLRAKNATARDTADANDLLDSAIRTIATYGQAAEDRLTYLRRFKCKKALTGEE